MKSGQPKNNRTSIEDINKKIPKDSFLTAIKHLPGTIPMPVVGRAATLFICKCGKEVVWYAGYVTDGRKKSCGCLVSGGHRRNAKYNYLSNKLRRVYYSMIGRCYIKTDRAYHWYGERGVRVCIEWKDNPQSFFDWAVISGYKEGLQIDKDKLGDGLLYSPETCCWITGKENAAYKKVVKLVVFNGVQMTIPDMIKKIGCGKDFGRTRVEKQVPPEQIKIEWEQFVKTGLRSNGFIIKRNYKAELS